MIRITSDRKNAINHEYVILECIRDNPGGVTSSDIANLTNFSRNTVSKYVLTLDRTNQIFSKKVGAYKLFFAKNEKYIPFETAITYYKALLSKFKKYFPNSEELIHLMGKEAANYIKFPFGPNVQKQLRTLKSHPLSRIILDSFKNLYSSYDIFQPNINITILNIDHEGQNATYRFKNSVFLENSHDFVYHLHIMCGISEGILEKALNREVLCKIDQIYISDNKGESFFDLSIKIK